MRCLTLLNYMIYSKKKKKKKQLKTPIELLVREEHELQYPKLKCYKIFFQTMSKSL